MDNGQSKEKLPTCPSCDTSPLRFGHNIMPTQSGALICCIWCMDCGHVLTISQVGQQGPKIVRPGMNPTLKGN